VTGPMTDATTNSAPLKDSFSQVAAHGDDVVLWFYAHLFHTHPEVRDLFPIAMTHQRDKLLGALGRIVADVDNLPVLVPFLQQLGRDHRKFETLADHYPAVGASLIATLEHFAGEHWTADLAEQWRLAYQLIADVMIRAAEEAGAVTPAWWEGKVTGHERRRFDIAVLTAQVSPELRYQPGQSVAIETALRPKLWRYYSPACAPRADGTIELHVRALDGGPVSSALVRELSVGDILRMGAPVGDMTLTHADARDLLLVAGGTGLAPLKALVDQLIGDPDTRHQRRVHLFAGVRTAEELYDLPALRMLAQQHPWLTVVPAVSQDGPFDGERGEICEVVARTGRWSDHEVYVCGPAAMVDATVARMLDLGIADDRIHYDSFAEQ
jgi:NAD(P)H-flavin reductase/hemoglobin-like flavoprotein